MTLTDLRYENCFRYPNTMARHGPEPDVPSPNLRRIVEAMKTGDLAPIIELGARIEAGNATSSEEETIQVYDAVPLLLRYVLDLSEMCLRREHALKECDVGIGHKAP